MLPHQLACKASALLVCHDPMKMAGRLGAAPSQLSFGDSAAQAGARPVGNERSAITALNSRVKLKGPGAAAVCGRPQGPPGPPFQ